VGVLIFLFVFLSLKRLYLGKTGNLYI
jgi:hypothetical protein